VQSVILFDCTIIHQESAHFTKEHTTPVLACNFMENELVTESTATLSDQVEAILG
jgi:hypothetical protein